jgi:type IV secretion system protein VirB1
MIIDITPYIQRCATQVAPSTMRAIVKTESNNNPWAIGLNHGKKLKYQPMSLTQAKSWVSYLEKAGYDFDVGLAQVNIRNIHKSGYSIIDMLDPCFNLYVASDILRKNYKSALQTTNNSQEALYKALSAYNTGNYHSGFNNGYVQRVVNNANNTDLPEITSTQTTHKKHIINQSILLDNNTNSSRSVVYAKNRSQIQGSNIQFAEN